MKKQISRREMLRMMGMTMAAATLAACTPAVIATTQATQPGPTAIPPTAAPPTAVPPTATAVPPTPTPAPTAMGNMDFTWYIPTQQNIPVAQSWIMKELIKRYVVQFDFTEALPGDNYNEKKKLAIASQTIPDIMSWVDPSMANQYGPEGAFLEITPLLDQLPNVKKYLDSDQIGKYTAYSADNKLWCIPGYNVLTLPIFDFSYMKAEFDGVGATTLETFDQVYDGLKKLKAKYPNSYPFSYRGKELGGNSIYWRQMVEMGFTEGKNGAWSAHADHNIAFEYDAKNWIVGPTAPGFQDAFAWLNKLYTEKLLDPEYLTIDMNGLCKRFKNKQTFMTCDFVGGLSGIPSLTATMGDGVLYPLPTPYATGKKQVLGTNGGHIYNQGTVLSASLKGERLTRVLQFMNWIYSDEFYNLFYWNSDVAAKDSNGNYHYTNEAMYAKDAKVMDVYQPWSIMANFVQNNFVCVKPGTPYADYVLTWLAADSNKDKYTPSPVLPFTTDQTTHLGDIQNKADDAFLTKAEQYVSNKIPMTQWDTLIAADKAAGDDEAAGIYNDVYKKYFKS